MRRALVDLFLPSREEQMDAAVESLAAMLKNLRPGESVYIERSLPDHHALFTASFLDYQELLLQRRVDRHMAEIRRRLGQGS